MIDGVDVKDLRANAWWKWSLMIAKSTHSSAVDASALLDAIVELIHERDQLKVLLCEALNGATLDQLRADNAALLVRDERCSKLSAAVTRWRDADLVIGANARGVHITAEMNEQDKRAIDERLRQDIAIALGEVPS